MRPTPPAVLYWVITCPTKRSVSLRFQAHDTQDPKAAAEQGAKILDPTFHLKAAKLVATGYNSKGVAIAKTIRVGG